MKFFHQNARENDLPRIVEIYNHAVATRTCSCDLEPTTVEARRQPFLKHSPEHRPFWVAEQEEQPEAGVIGYLAFYHFMNERPGYFITADLAIYLHPNFHGKGLGSYLLSQAIEHAPTRGIETLTATIFSSNIASVHLFRKFGFEQWGYMPRVARLEGVEKDVVLVGRRIS